jgi:hypothetical protein
MDARVLPIAAVTADRRPWTKARVTTNNALRPGIKTMTKAATTKATSSGREARADRRGRLVSPRPI